MMLQSVSLWRKHWFTAGGDVSEVGVGVTAENVKEQHWGDYDAFKQLKTLQQQKSVEAENRERQTAASGPTERTYQQGVIQQDLLQDTTQGHKHMNCFCVQAPREQIKSLFIDWFDRSLQIPIISLKHQVSLKPSVVQLSDTGLSSCSSMTRLYVNKCLHEVYYSHYYYLRGVLWRLDFRWDLDLEIRLH